MTPAPSLDRRAVPELYIRWVDPETRKIVGWERVPETVRPDTAIRAAVVKVTQTLLAEFP